jgi:hypothetical protein
VFLLSCQTELKNFKQVSSDSLITIEASLSNALENHRVYLSYASPNLTGDTREIPISGATVDVLSDEGIRTLFTEIEKGVYQSGIFAGIVGGKYTLNIVLKDGKKFQSSAEEILEVRPIKAVSSNFTVKSNFPEADQRRLGFDVTLNFDDPAKEGQYYQWDWEHYERATYCATCDNGFDYSKGTCGSSSAVLPTYELTNSIRPINYGCGENCFDVIRSTEFNLFADNLSNGQLITDLPLLRIPFDGIKDYYVEIEQRSINKKVYEYLSILKDATQNAGTMFDVPPITPLSPNITCVSDPNEKILGVFSVYGVDKRAVYIDRQTGTDGYSRLTRRILGRGALAAPGSFMTPTAPCIEGKYRTKQTPKEWRDS